jgi:nucleotide-binding universal stress UspA family protein
MNSTETASTERAPSWIRHLVVAADASAASREGLRIAMEAARRTGARISVVHVRHVPAGAYLSQSTAPGPVEETLDEVEAEVRRATAEAMNGTDLDWTFVVLRGSPGEELVRFVAEEGADMVVVGSNRHSSLHNLLLGSTSAYLTSHSPAAVLVARPQERSPEPAAGLAGSGVA